MVFFLVKQDEITKPNKELPKTTEEHVSSPKEENVSNITKWKILNANSRSITSSNKKEVIENVKNIIPHTVITDTIAGETTITNLWDFQESLSVPPIKFDITEIENSKAITARKVDALINLKMPIAKISSTQIDPENILKESSNGHALVHIRRARIRGFCVECIKRNPDPKYKKNMLKIYTYCPQCPGGNWICEKCYDEVHAALDQN